MTRAEFADGVQHLRLAFNLDPVRKEVLGVWYRLGLEQIGADEWQSIQRRIASTEERWPANFVRCVLSYREHKPQAFDLKPPEDCDPEAGRAFVKSIMASIARAETSTMEEPF